MAAGQEFGFIMPQPMTLREELESGLSHQQAGRFAEAERIYQQVLSRHPDHLDALHLLGILAMQMGRPDKAVELIQRAIGRNPGFADAHVNLGIALVKLGQFEAAIAAFRRAIELKPGVVETHINLGNALKLNGRIDEAIECYRRAVQLKPDFAEAHFSLAKALRRSGRLDEAAAAFRETARLNPDDAAAHANIGSVLNSMGRFDEAIASLRQAVRLKPDLAIAHNNLATTLRDTGQLDEAISCYRQALRVDPDYTAAHSNLVLTLNYHPASDAKLIDQELRRWNQQHAQPLAKLIAPCTNNRDPKRRLRLGYVSADFYDHTCALFFLPLFRHHDRDQFEVFCYSEGDQTDKVTRLSQDQVQHWRSTRGVTDAAAAELVRGDQIDILVDLKVHTSGNRLLVFAQKPAPVQVTWLGYPGTTGLDTIDYRLTDRYLDPPELDDARYRERSVHLPDTFWCYDPIDREPAVNPPPCMETGFVTFGCLNAFCKVNENVLRLWAQVLRTVDRSRMLILCPEGSHRELLLDLMQREGIHRDRIELIARRPRPQYLEIYHRIDVGLDTFPYNGHTTSLDSFWMGVPVVTLVDKTTVGRAGVSQSTNLGLTELIAQTPQQYVEIAAGLAGDLPRLADLRRTLRPRMEASPLMDAGRFTRNIEAAYRELWRTWCMAGGNSGLQCPAK
jgi:protein O-GlcNAc transferase